MDTDPRTIGKWLDVIQDGHLALPRFQRESVWKAPMTNKFLESVLLHPDRPVGTFLVLETTSNEPVFPPRHFDGAEEADLNNCRDLLLDGQQRLTSLWKALKNRDDEVRYYIEFDDNYVMTRVRNFSLGSKKDDKYFSTPESAYKEHLFPACLLDPLEDNSIVAKWVSKTNSTTVAQISRLISDTRAVFRKIRARNSSIEPYVIPFFKLTEISDENEAITIYQDINTNSVKLSHYYLAVAKMENDTDKSLYEIAKEIDNKLPDLQGRKLESDNTGELILKIFCLMKGRPPSGGQYKSLPYEELITPAVQANMYDGIEWAVNRLNELKIWDGRQLPSTIPLRVLPALHSSHEKYIRGTSSSGRAQRTGSARKLINRYLWHTFLTERYTGARINTLLKEDYEALKVCFDNNLQDRFMNAIPIFKESRLTDEKIKKANWPKSKSIIARGILLACCQDGANDPISGVPMDRNNTDGNNPGTTSTGRRELHHIFPKSKSMNMPGDRKFNPNLALNCLFISMPTNRAFNNYLPGTYLENIFKEVKPGSDFDKRSVQANLQTHNIPLALSGTLIDIKDDTHRSQNKVKIAYKNFLDQRVTSVKRRINKLLRDGEV